MYLLITLFFMIVLAELIRFFKRGFLAYDFLGLFIVLVYFFVLFKVRIDLIKNYTLYLLFGYLLIVNYYTKKDILITAVCGAIMIAYALMIIFFEMLGEFFRFKK